jgi:hypothetical protein
MALTLQANLSFTFQKKGGCLQSKTTTLYITTTLVFNYLVTADDFAGCILQLKLVHGAW